MPIHEPDISVYQYLREMERFVLEKAQRNHLMAFEFIKNDDQRTAVQNKNNAVKAAVKRLVTQYCVFLDGDRKVAVKFSDDELNALLAVHNMRKRDHKESIETLISFSAGSEAITAVEDLMARDLKALQAFMALVAEMKTL
jgi:hypothetical protein